MTSRLVAASALVLAALAAQPTLAQTAASAPSRSDVKSQIPADRTKDQNITGERMPTSDQLPPKGKRAGGSADAKGRGDVKSQIPADRTKDQNITGERMPTAEQLPPKGKSAQ